MRKRLIILLLLCAACMMAQEKYSEVLEKAEQLSPYEAIYLLMDYQQTHPNQASLYFHLGNLCYDLIPSYDPLHNYKELTELLYRTKLFYGNCLHFAKDQKLPGWQYATIAKGEKKIDYVTLSNYLQPRLDEVVRKQKACDSIHNSFYRLVEQYNRCQNSYSLFLSYYAREKTAHLQLTPQQREDLDILAQEASKLNELKESYLKALSLEPINAYNPSFHWKAIELYRLDGLTATDFLQNDITLWDYQRWVEHFLKEQDDLYQRLYSDVQDEYERLSFEIKQYTRGTKISGKTDESIAGRCARLELTSQQAQALSSMQSLIHVGYIEQQIGETKTVSTLRELVPLLLLAREAESHHPKITIPDFQPTGDSAIALIRAHMARLAQPLSITQQSTYTSTINGEVIKYDTPEGERTFSLLNMTDGWRCVVIEEEQNALKVIDLNSLLIMRSVIFRVFNETPLVITAMPEGGWALITDKKIHWGK